MSNHAGVRCRQQCYMGIWYNFSQVLNRLNCRNNISHCIYLDHKSRFYQRGIKCNSI
ncbi:protein of unknown function (plasmid) [Azospirillum baldaniorum]|uniref:Uncharacterized protein n=1 Tax=Azospirillum baldaniorum TaxID=1064539 RepID=A0A9P1K203_9PROT|nr:protein of unknown function [Azospirillum baldaniorum]